MAEQEICWSQIRPCHLRRIKPIFPSITNRARLNPISRWNGGRLRQNLRFEKYWIEGSVTIWSNKLVTSTQPCWSPSPDVERHFAHYLVLNVRCLKSLISKSAQYAFRDPGMSKNGGGPRDWYESLPALCFLSRDRSNLSFTSLAFMSDQDDLPPEYRDIPRDQLKHGKGRFKNVILVPQPSDSPNDPLNVSVSIFFSLQIIRKKKQKKRPVSFSNH